MWPFGKKRNRSIVESEVVKRAVIVLDDDEFEAILAIGKDVVIDVNEFDPEFGMRHTITFRRRGNGSN